MAADPPPVVEPVLHLVTPQSQGKPLCGEKSPDAAIGSYCEHIGDDGEWCRAVFGKSGKTGRACEACLVLYPSLLWGRPQRLEDALTLQTVLTISPYPQSMRDEFHVKGHCVSEDFIVEREPSVVGQYAKHGKVALTLLTHVVPKPPATLSPNPHKSNPDEKHRAQIREIRRVRRGSRK